MARPPVHKIPNLPCPLCQHLLDGAFENGQPKNRAPAAGDHLLCGACAALLKFDETLNLVAVSPKELAEIVKDDPGYAALIRKSQTTIRRIKHYEN